MPRIRPTAIEFTACNNYFAMAPHRMFIGKNVSFVCSLKKYDDVHIKCWCMFYFQREAINRTRALLEKRRAERMDAELKRIEAERVGQ